MFKITFCKTLSILTGATAAASNRQPRSEERQKLNIFKKSVFYPSETGANICTDKHCQYKIQICRLNGIVYPVNIMLCSLGDRNSVKIKEIYITSK